MHSMSFIHTGTGPLSVVFPIIYILQWKNTVHDFIRLFIKVKFLAKMLNIFHKEPTLRIKYYMYLVIILSQNIYNTTIHTPEWRLHNKNAK